MGSRVHLEKYVVQEGHALDFADWPTDGTSDYKGSEAEALEESKKLTGKLERLQEVLYAEHKHKVLIVLQAMDTGGKDGTIKKVFEGVNPQGVRVTHFRQPTPEEADHDFLWKAHQQAPGSGEMVIFNRSYYEGVLIERVHGLVTEKVWTHRYKEIRQFEKLLEQDRTLVLKFFLHIDKAEQKKRLEERLADPSKRWKFSVFDERERKFWPQYMKAYEDALKLTSTDSAPWYIVPSNKKWFRDLVVSTAIVERLQGLKMGYPKIKFEKSTTI